MKKLGLTLLVVASMLLVGCGSKPEVTAQAAPPDVSPAGPALTVDAYSAKLNEISKASDTAQAPNLKLIADAKAIQEKDKDKAMEMLLTAFQAMLKEQDELVGKLQAINPPADLVKVHGIIVKGNKDIAGNFREAIGAIQSKDKDKVDQLQTQLGTVAAGLAKDLPAALDEAGYKMDPSGSIVKK